MDFKEKSIISIRDLNQESLREIIKVSSDVKKGKYKNFLRKKVIATLFFEPSTRTRLSFESAAKQMGAEVIGFAGADYTSVKKGETLGDTIRTVSGYCNVIVMRHPVEGSSRYASEVATVPVINAGDGANQHPTQTFLDLFTMSEYFSDFKNLRVGFLGDLKFGRTVHSLAYALSLFGSTIWLISPEILRMPEFLVDELRINGSSVREIDNLELVDEPLDVLYVTRIQKERFGDFQEYMRVAGSYRITRDVVESLGKDIKIMHPLPRVDEIDPEVDEMENAIYFHQAHNGIPVRQAILGMVLDVIP
ncbi:MAG: aspartate carbamoyltransferase [Spirochaetes bacterium]|nr:MAG: aspartate carbamoyltransferase [Spirochaetota bacterium]